MLSYEDFQVINFIRNLDFFRCIWIFIVAQIDPLGTINQTQNFQLFPQAVMTFSCYQSEAEIVISSLNTLGTLQIKTTISSHQKLLPLVINRKTLLSNSLVSKKKDLGKVSFAFSLPCKKRTLAKRKKTFFKESLSALLPVCPLSFLRVLARVYSGIGTRECSSKLFHFDGWHFINFLDVYSFSCSPAS